MTSDSELHRNDWSYIVNEKTMKGIFGVFTEKNVMTIFSSYPEGASARTILDDWFGGFNEPARRRLYRPIHSLVKKGLLTFEEITVGKNRKGGRSTTHRIYRTVEVS